MSQENVEIVRRVYDAAARRDSATVLALYDPDIELDASQLGVAGIAGGDEAVYRGHDGLRRFFSARARFGVRRCERVAHGAVWSFGDGKVIEAISYPDPAEALEAVGLSE